MLLIKVGKDWIMGKGGGGSSVEWISLLRVRVA